MIKREADSGLRAGFITEGSAPQMQHEVEAPPKKKLTKPRRRRGGDSPLYLILPSN